jgi:hypothetical protein
MSDLVVIAAHGNEHIGPCLASLGDRYPILVVDTASPEPIVVPEGVQLHRMRYSTYQTGAYLWAYEEVEADNYLFLQDSLRALQPDYVEPFRAGQPERGCAAWAIYFSKSTINLDFGQHWYSPPCNPTFGIFGSIFYTNRSSLDELAARQLLPPVPRRKIHDMQNEWMWSWAFHEAGMEVRTIGGEWNHEYMMAGKFPIFSKQWANRQ